MTYLKPVLIEKFELILLIIITLNIQFILLVDKAGAINF